MTRDEIRQMAREAGLPMAWISESGVLRWKELERFAALVASAERETLAKHFEHLSGTRFAEEVADEIRARGNN